MCYHVKPLTKEQCREGICGCLCGGAGKGQGLGAGVLNLDSNEEKWQITL